MICFATLPLGPVYRLDQPQPLQARVPVLADDDVVVHGNAERARDIDDRFCHLDVGLRRRRVAGGMVVQEAIARLIELKTQQFLKSRMESGTWSGTVTGDDS